MAGMRTLIGDIGGTNTRLAIADGGHIVRRVTWPSEGGLEPLLDRFLTEQAERIQAACLAVAGPVFGGAVHLTNLGWRLDAARLSARLGVPVRLINDFHAQALAVTALTPQDWVELAPTRQSDQVAGDCIAVLGAGTGLGEAILAPGEHGWVVVAGEGSHKRFAPRNTQEIELLRAFAARYGEHVSVERVASGPGLVAIYDHLRGSAPRHPAMQQMAPAAVITREALAGGCPTCQATVDIFIGVLADEAAGVALQCNAGAVYLGGGIAPRLLPLLRCRFRPAFESKGRYGPWLATLPVRVLTHPDPGLLGARIAAQALRPISRSAGGPPAE